MGQKGFTSETAKKAGKKGKPGKHLKTLQWEKLGESITGLHAENFNKILLEYLEPNKEGIVTEKQKDKFISTYLNVLNYFKPKMQSTTLHGEVKTPVVNLSLRSEEALKAAKSLSGND